MTLSSLELKCWNLWPEEKNNNWAVFCVFQVNSVQRVWRSPNWLWNAVVSTKGAFHCSQAYSTEPHMKTIFVHLIYKPQIYKSPLCSESLSVPTFSFCSLNLIYNLRGWVNTWFSLRQHRSPSYATKCTLYWFPAFCFVVTIIIFKSCGLHLI